MIFQMNKLKPVSIMLLAVLSLSLFSGCNVGKRPSTDTSSESRHVTGTSSGGSTDSTDIELNDTKTDQPIILKVNSNKNVHAVFVSSGSPSENVIWKSDDTSVVSIGTDGLLTAKRIGVTEIHGALKGSNLSVTNHVYTYSNDLREEVPFFVNGVKAGTYTINSVHVRKITRKEKNSETERVTYAVDYGLVINNTNGANTINRAEVGVSSVPPTSESRNTVIRPISVTPNIINVVRGGSGIMYATVDLNSLNDVPKFIILQSIGYLNDNKKLSVDLKSVFNAKPENKI